MIRRMLEQHLVSDKRWAALSIDLNKIRVYNETYGDLAGDQLIKALGAILTDIADENEFVGHIEASTELDLDERRARPTIGTGNVATVEGFVHDYLFFVQLIHLGHDSA